MTYWQQIFRHHGEYFDQRRRVIRRCAFHIHEVVEDMRAGSPAWSRVIPFVALLLIAVGFFSAAAIGIGVFREHAVRQVQAEMDAVVRNGLRPTLLKFYDDNGRFPTESEGLEALTDYMAGKRWAYQLKLVDPWDAPYIYRVAADGSWVEIFSYGADGDAEGNGLNGDFSCRITAAN